MGRNTLLIMLVHPKFVATGPWELLCGALHLPDCMPLRALVVWVQVWLVCYVCVRLVDRYAPWVIGKSSRKH